jgi:hypothetical protein
MKFRDLRVAVSAAVLAAAVGCSAAPASAGGSDRIVDVVLETGYEMGYGGMMTVVFRPRVLYKDGTYTSDANTPLQPQPRIDGRWRRGGKGFELVGNDGKQASIAAKMRARPARAGQSLDGSFRSMSGVGSPNTGVPVVATWKDLVFSPDGTLRDQRGAGVSGDGVAASSQSAESMRYRLDGYTITLTRADGSSETRLFYFFPDGDRVIGLGSSTLSMRR